MNKLSGERKIYNEPEQIRTAVRKNTNRAWRIMHELFRGERKQGRKERRYMQVNLHSKRDSRGSLSLRSPTYRSAAH